MTRAACYVRMSTDDQENSPERQRRDLTEFAEKQGYVIVEWYEDHGISGTSINNRTDFQRLEAEAKEGRFELLLACELSRLSREEPLAAMNRFSQLLKAGIRIQTINGRFIDFSDIGGLITTLVDSHGAHNESKLISVRSNSGKRTKYSSGIRACGIPVFGYARQMIDSGGNVQRVVKHNERYRKPPEWSEKLVFDPRREYVEAVRWMFQAVLDGTTIYDIRNEMNQRGLKTFRGNEFSYSTVRGMLRNPVYKGELVAGENCSGQFSRLVEDHEEPIRVPNAHPALIDPETFDEVNRLLATGAVRKKRESMPLSGMLICPDCGEKMYGSQNRRGKTRFPVYACTAAWREGREDSGFYLSAVAVHRAVLGLVSRSVFTAENVELMLQTYDLMSGSSSNDDAEAVVSLSERIATVEENFALAADKAQFDVLHRQLIKLREEKDELVKRLKRRRAARKGAQPITEGLHRLASDPSALFTADPEIVKACVGLVIQSIYPRRQDTGNYWDYQKKSYTIEVHLTPGLWDHESLTLNNLDMGTVTCAEAIFRVLDREPMRLRPLADALEFQFEDGTIRTSLRRLESEGLVSHQSGYRGALTYWLSDAGRAVARTLKRKPITVEPDFAAIS